MKLFQGGGGPPGPRGVVGREGQEGVPGMDGALGKDGSKGMPVRPTNTFLNLSHLNKKTCSNIECLSRRVFIFFLYVSRENMVMMGRLVLLAKPAHVVKLVFQDFQGIKVELDQR